MEIYLVRHGTTEWNKLKKIQGQSDIPLDSTGLEMAHETGLALKYAGISFDRIFSSPLVRAYRTAIELCAGREELINIIEKDDRLKELNFGNYEGHTLNECTLLEGSTFEFFHSSPEKFFPYGSGESLGKLCIRAKDFMQNVAEPLYCSGAERILITAHGALNKAILMYVRGEKDIANFWGDGLQANCCITIINVCQDSHKNFIYTIKENKTLYDPSLQKKAGNLLG